jgi:hypothetical protein
LAEVFEEAIRFANDLTEEAAFVGMCDQLFDDNPVDAYRTQIIAPD